VSAGAGLAAALALLERERVEVRPVFQLLAYPMLDDRTANRTDIDETHIRCWDKTANRFGWRSCLGVTPGSIGIDPLAAPAWHTDLSGLPPAWMGVGSLALFYEEGIVYADRLTAAGVVCDRLVVAGAFHAFDLARPRAGVSWQFRAAQTQALADALKRP
jgi:acetyl esterase/lipase